MGTGDGGQLGSGGSHDTESADLNDAGGVVPEQTTPEEIAGADEDRGDAAGGSGPRGVLGWIAAPFKAVYRFCFPRTPRPFLVELPFLLVIALFLSFLIKTFLIQAFVIPSGSMQNTLAIGDRVIVNRLGNWLGEQPQRGDIVVFGDPGDWLGAPPAQSRNPVTRALTWIGVLPEDNGDLIKRVIGVGGDTVHCCDTQGRVTVDGTPLNEGSYLYPGNTPSTIPFTVTIPKGYLWVMGDHRAISEDSRLHQNIDHGFVPVSKVVGRAIAIVWPPSQWNTLSVPSTFHQNFTSRALGDAGRVPPAAYGAAAVLPFGALRVRRRRRRNRLGGESEPRPTSPESERPAD
jgi:signal peptidase I